MSRESVDFSLGNCPPEPSGTPFGPLGGGSVGASSGDGGPAEVSRPAFWEDLYARREDGWEIGGPAPPLEALLARRPLPRGRAAVLGCGRGYDARLLAACGHEVWGFDFSPFAIAEAKRLAEGEPQARAAAGALSPGALRFEQRDIFSLADAYPAFFDLVWEHTCFCAIDPARRPEYVQLVRGILKPDGLLAGLFYPLREGSGGPPFPTSQAEVRGLFEPSFTFLEAAIPAESIERRRSIEWLVLLQPHPPGPST